MILLKKLNYIMNRQTLIWIENFFYWCPIPIQKQNAVRSIDIGHFLCTCQLNSYVYKNYLEYLLFWINNFMNEILNFKCSKHDQLKLIIVFFIWKIVISSYTTNTIVVNNKLLFVNFIERRYLQSCRIVYFKMKDSFQSCSS